MFEDKTLVCRDCGKEFVFSASEQQFFADKGFQNDPTRCHECRAARRNRENPARAERQYFEVICDGCGATTQVPSGNSVFLEGDSLVVVTSGRGVLQQLNDIFL